MRQLRHGTSQDVGIEVSAGGKPEPVRYRLLPLPMYLVERLPERVANDMASFG